MTIQEVMLFTRNLDVLYVEDDELLQFQTKHLFENFLILVLLHVMALKLSKYTKIKNLTL